jgi:hypothetical protein
MSTVYGANRTKLNDVPSEKIDSGEVNGKAQIAYDEYTFPANIMALNDIIDMALDIPAGARILDAGIIAPSTGTTGQFKLGTSGDDDALIALADTGGQAVKSLSPAGAADLGKKLTAATSYQVKCIEATDAAIGLKLQAWVKYVK